MLEAICEAAEAGDPERIKTLLADGADPNTMCGNFGVLYHAMRVLPHQKAKPSLACVQLLVEAGANIQVAWDGGETALFTACAEGHPDVVRYLLEKGADVSTALETGFNSLHLIAAEAGGRPMNVQLTKVVDGAHETITDPEQIREIFGQDSDAEYAAYLEIVGILFQHGIDVDAIESNGQTALFQAAGAGCSDIVRMLLSKKARTDIRDRWGLTALHYAAREGHVAVVDALLEVGTDVNAADDAGFTALHEAASNGHVDVSSALLSAGADASAALKKDYDRYKAGMTPIEVARYRGKDQIVILLERAAAPEERPNTQASVPLTEEEAREIAKALKAGRKWSRRGRAGYGLSYADGRFFHHSYDEDRDDRIAFDDEGTFIDFLLRRDLTDGSYKHLRQDFQL